MRSLANSATLERNSAVSVPTEGALPHDDVTISLHESTVPAFVEQELDQLYQNLNSSLMHHSVQRKAKEASTYIVRRNGHAIVILLFTRKNDCIHVINEMIDIPNEELTRFASHVFSLYKTVSVISFSLIGKHIGKLPFPCQQHDGSEDIVLTLPSKPSTYLDSLSPKMRRNIRRYLRTIKHDHPTFHSETTVGAEISDQHMRDLIKLKKVNMGAKNIKFGIDEEELEWIMRQAKLSGLVTIALIDGKVCGGSIALRVKDNFFGEIIAYDLAYQKYSLGILCTYLTVCDQILHGGAESHLCWGRYQYKYKLAGIQRDRASLDIYRSRADYCRHAGTILLKKIKTGIKDGKNRLLDMEHEEGTIARATTTLIGILRKMKRSRSTA